MSGSGEAHDLRKGDSHSHRGILLDDLRQSDSQSYRGIFLNINAMVSVNEVLLDEHFKRASCLGSTEPPDDEQGIVQGQEGQDQKYQQTAPCINEKFVNQGIPCH